MKKIFFTLLIASMVLSLSLTGCSNGEENADVIPDTEDVDTDEASDKEEDKEEETNIVISQEMINQKVAELEEALPDMDIDIEVIKNLAADIEEYKTIDVEPVPDRNGNILKYKVREIDYEGIDDSSGTYTLCYYSDAPASDVVFYFYMLLSGTQDFGFAPPSEATSGSYVLIGHLRGMKVDLWVEDLGDDELSVSISCFE